MNSGTVDLIATDPPFDKGRDFHATPDSLAAGTKFHDRWSWERDMHQSWADQITNWVLLCGPCNRSNSNEYTLIGLRKLNERKGWMAKLLTRKRATKN